MSGILLVILGAWAGIVPFIGPYLDFAYAPSTSDAWNWTAGRGWLNVFPGAVTIVGGLLLVASTSRLVTLVGAWMAAVSGAWLIVGPTIAAPLELGPGRPDPASSDWVQALEVLFFYLAIGAVILGLACVALGRLSVHSVRDMRLAQRRAEAEAERARETQPAPEAAGAAPGYGPPAGYGTPAAPATGEQPYPPAMDEAGRPPTQPPTTQPPTGNQPLSEQQPGQPEPPPAQPVQQPRQQRWLRHRPRASRTHEHSQRRQG